GSLLDQSGFQLLQRAIFDLPDALLRYAERFAERFKRGAVLRKPPSLDDLHFALVEHAKRVLQPDSAAFDIDRLLDDLVGQRAVRNKEIGPFGRRSAVIEQGRVERGV